MERYGDQINIYEHTYATRNIGLVAWLQLWKGYTVLSVDRKTRYIQLGIPEGSDVEKDRIDYANSDCKRHDDAVLGIKQTLFK